MDLSKLILGAALFSLSTMDPAMNAPEMRMADAHVFSVVQQFIKNETQSALEDHSSDVAEMISDTILTESQRHGLDPLLLMAVAYHESHFRMLATGSHGELGLMQIRPTTAQWIARRFGLPWNGAHTLLNPVVNIQIGAAYLSYLRDRFHGRKDFFLTAYNMGPQKLTLLLKDDEEQPRAYAFKVNHYYKRFKSRYHRERVVILAQAQ